MTGERLLYILGLVALLIISLPFKWYAEYSAGEEEYQMQVERWRQHSVRKCYPYQLKDSNFRHYTWKCSVEKE
jgi:hypothetical protein